MMKLRPKLVLGSQSPFRKKILEEIGLVFDVRTADIDEKAIRNKDFRKLVMTLGLAKRDAILAKNKFDKNTILITSDLVVVHNGELREKPISKQEVIRWHKDYHKGETKVYCSIVVHHVGKNKTLKAVDVASIKWNKIPDHVILEMADNPMTYKGAGFIDRAFYNYTRSFKGTVNTVRGIPIQILEKFLKEFEYFK